MSEGQSGDDATASPGSVDPDLGSKDIKFLRAIQEVNAREGYKPGTDERPPATTSSIATAADLSKNEVNYRFNQRGFDEDGLGYITVYGAQLLENGALSAKSAELTEKGEAALTEVLEGGSSTSGEIDADLEERLSALEDEMEQLRELIQQFDESETGAWSVDREEQFDATLNAMVAYQRIFSEVFEIDVSEFRGEGEIADSTVAEARQQFREVVNGQ